MMNRSSIYSWGRVGLVLAAGAALSAQETGQVSGVIKAQDGKAIAGATVVVKAPQLIQARTVTTAADGSYRVPLLPPGDYTLTVSANGFISGGAQLRIGIGTRLTQDLSLKSTATQTATVEVVATSAVVDKADTKAATNFSASTLEALPATDRAFYGAAQLAPGVTTTGTGSVAIRGGKTQSTVYTLNGASVGDDYQGQQYENRVVDDAIEDVQVIQSPLNARFGRTGGGVINAVTKGGGNEFKGSIRTYLSRTDWAAWRPYQRENDARSDAYSSRGYDIFFSGPILKDRLWFAVSTVIKPPVSTNDTLLAGEDPTQWTAGPLASPGDLNAVFGVPEVPYAFDLGRTLTSSSKYSQWTGKLTFAISADHTIEYEYYKRDNTTTNRNPYGVPIVMTVQSNSLQQKDESSTHNFLYRGALSSSVFIEANYSKLKSGASFPSPNLPHLRWTTGNQGVFFPYGFNIAPGRDGRDNSSGNLNIKVFADAAGSHEIDAGVDFYQFERTTQTQNGTLNRRFYIPYITDAATANTALPTGFPAITTNDPYGNAVGFFASNLADNVAIFGANPGVNGFAPVYQQYYGQDGITKNKTIALYINDQWTINNHWNLMAGLRQDRFTVTDTDGAELISKTAPVSPRVMLKYDVDGDSRRVFTFTAAKFVEDFRAGFTDAFVKKGNTRWARFGWSAFTPGDYGFVSYNDITNTANYGGPNGLGTVAGGPYQVFDSSSANRGINNISNPYALEFTVGYRRTYNNGSFISMNFVNRAWKNDFAIWTDLDTSNVVYLNDPSGISPTQIGSMVTNFGNSDLLKRSYRALEMEFMGRISDVWTVNGTYTYSALRGNTEGGDSTSQGFRDNSASAVLNLRNWLLSSGHTPGYVGGAWSQDDIAPEGALSSDRAHKLRMIAMARLPLGKGWVSYSFIGSYDSGAPYSAVGANATQSALFLAGLPATPARPTAPTSFGRFYSGRGAFRTNDFYSVDFKFAFEVPVAFGVKLMGDVTVNNVFNNFLQRGWNAGFSGTTVSAANRANPLQVADRSQFGTDSGLYTNYAGSRSVAASIGLRF